jgi:hypothetical protein
MSARSRAVPWFGTLGERLEAAETEARAADAQWEMDFMRAHGLDSVSGFVRFAEAHNISQYASNADPGVIRIQMAAVLRNLRMGRIEGAA